MNLSLKTLLTGFPSIVELPVAWGDMDAFGHVNNVVYFHYFECARVEYLQRLGWFERMKTTGIGPIVHSTQCRFRKPLAYPDQILVGSRIITIGSDRVTFEHRLISQHWGELAAEGQAVIVCFDYRANRKTAIPDDLRHRIDELEASA
jgi:acyl-CoA thioester hydrolase